MLESVLAFFKLSLGLGSMSTYASYFQSNTNLMRNALQVVIADTTVSMLAGLAIFPAVFSFGKYRRHSTLPKHPCAWL